MVYFVSATPFRGGFATLNPPLGHTKVRQEKVSETKNYLIKKFMQQNIQIIPPQSQKAEAHASAFFHILLFLSRCNEKYQQEEREHRADSDTRAQGGTFGIYAEFRGK